MFFLYWHYLAKEIFSFIGQQWNEIIKDSEYNERFEKFYFWRTQEQQEIDLIIEKNGQLKTIEIKWNPKVKAKLSKAFSNKYANHTFTVINSDNFFEYLMGT